MSQQPLPLARTTDLNVDRVGQETLIYDRKTDKAYVLNPAAAAVWRACNGQRTVQELSMHLSQDAPTAEQTVWYALGQLNDLLEEPVALPPELAGLSRRKFLRLSGAVAAGVVMPLVVNMVTPSPAHAQSGGCCVCLGGLSSQRANCALCLAFCLEHSGHPYDSCIC